MTRKLPLFRHEPAEPAALDSVNEALDRVEADARAVIEAGGEVALRLRLSRVLDGIEAQGGNVNPPPPAKHRLDRRRA